MRGHLSSEKSNYIYRRRRIYRSEMEKNSFTSKSALDRTKKYYKMWEFKKFWEQINPWHFYESTPLNWLEVIIRLSLHLYFDSFFFNQLLYSVTLKIDFNLCVIAVAFATIKLTWTFAVYIYRSMYSTYISLFLSLSIYIGRVETQRRIIEDNRWKRV